MDHDALKTFRSDGLDIAYIDVAAQAGDDANPDPREDIAEPILLIHGFASTHVVNWVNTSWLRTLTRAGRRVIALDNRGHGRSDKPHDPAAYHPAVMAEDARRLLDHLDIPRADIMGYSMGARISAYFALNRPERARSVLFGGLGIHLIDGGGLPLGIADAMEAPSLDNLTDPNQRMFRAFADANKADRLALAACIRGSRAGLTRAEAAGLRMPVLISVGTKDDIAGRPQPLADIIPGAQVVDIPGRDHNLAVGDKVHKAGVLAFLDNRP